MAFQSDKKPTESKLSDKLADLLSVEHEISHIIRRTDRLQGKSLTIVRDLIRDALHKAYEIASDFNPKEMSVEAGIGIPPRISVSFNWPIAQTLEEKEGWYDELLR